jgi:hypothetical protein
MIGIQEEDLVQLRTGFLQPLLDEELARDLEVLGDEGLGFVGLPSLVHDLVHRRGAGRQRQQRLADFHRLDVLGGGEELPDLRDSRPNLGDHLQGLGSRGGLPGRLAGRGGDLRLFQQQRGHPNAFFGPLIVRLRRQNLSPCLDRLPVVAGVIERRGFLEELLEGSVFGHRTPCRRGAAATGPNLCLLRRESNQPEARDLKYNLPEMS